MGEEMLHKLRAWTTPPTSKQTNKEKNNALWLMKDYFWWFDPPFPALFSLSVASLPSGFVEIKYREEVGMSEEDTTAEGEAKER